MEILERHKKYFVDRRDTETEDKHSDTVRRIVADYGYIQPYECARCGNTGTTNTGQKFSLEVHHKNGKYDNRLESLELLCPNCHAAEKSSNINLNKKRYSITIADLETLMQMYRVYGSARAALRNMRGMNQRDSNWSMQIVAEARRRGWPVKRSFNTVENVQSLSEEGKRIYEEWKLKGIIRIPLYNGDKFKKFFNE